MRKIKLSKLDAKHIEGLQAHVERYISQDIASSMKDPDKLFQAILETSICKSIWRHLRTKMESDSRRFTVILSPEQAVLLLVVCQTGYNASDPTSHLWHVALSVMNDIDEQLKNLKSYITQFNTDQLYLQS